MENVENKQANHGRIAGGMGGGGENSHFTLIFLDFPKKNFLSIVTLLKNSTPPLTNGKTGKMSSPHYSRKIGVLMFLSFAHCALRTLHSVFGAHCMPSFACALSVRCTLQTAPRRLPPPLIQGAAGPGYYRGHTDHIAWRPNVDSVLNVVACTISKCRLAVIQRFAICTFGRMFFYEPQMHSSFFRPLHVVQFQHQVGLGQLGHHCAKKNKQWGAVSGEHIAHATAANYQMPYKLSARR